MIIDSPIISGSFAASGSLNQFGDVVISGSLTVTGSIIGTASYATTASYLSGYVSPFPFTGSAIVSGSLDVTGSLKVTGSITSTGTITAQTLVVQTVSSSVIYSSGSNVFGNDLANTQVLTGSVTITGSLAVNGSNAILTNQTSSMSASYAVSASYALNSTSASFATTSSFSLNVPVTASYANNATSASYALTSSFSLNVPVTASFANNATSASFATTASYLTGYISPFPYTGSAIISGSLGITGSLAATTLSGVGVRYLVADTSGSITAQTASAAIKQTQAFTSSANQTSFTIDNGYTTGLVDVFINGTKLAPGVEFTDTTGTVITLATGSNSGDLVEFVKYFPASGVTNNVLRQLTTFTASAGQTVFSASYTPGLLDIFYNGSRLSPSDFTANNGTFFTLATGSAANDILDVLVYSYQVGAFSGIGGVGTATQVAYFDTTNSITGSPNFTISGSTMTVTGSLIVSGSGTFTNIGPAVFSGSLTSTAGFTGSFLGTATSASYADNAELLDGLDSTVFTLTSSFAAFTASQNILNGTYATTGSNTFAGIQTVNSNLVVTGSITAQTLVVQTITSSVDFVTGSTRFGSILGNTHVFSGSVSMNPGGLFVSGSSNIGIGTTNPRSYKFHLVNSGSNAQFGISNQGTADGDRQLRIGFGGNGANTYAELQGTRLNVADDVNIALQPGGGYVGIGTTSPTSVLEVSSGSNAQTGIRVRNSTAGTSAGVEFGAYTNSGNGGFGKYSTANTPYKNISAASTYVYNGSSGDIALLNDVAAGNISFAAGASSTAHLTIASTGAATFFMPRSSGANVDIMTLSDNVTGVQTSGFGVRILATSNNGQAKSAIAFEADGGTNNDTAIAFYTQTSAAAMPQRLIIDKNGTVRVNTLGGSTNYKFGVSGSAYVNGTNNKGVFITDGASYASIVGLNREISAYNSLELRASGVDGQLYLTSGGNVGFFTTNPSGSVSSNLVHISGQSSGLRVGPCFPAINGTVDRDFLEILPGGSTTTILAPNEEFLLSNPGGGAGSWSINVIAGSGGVRLTNGATSWAAISDIRQKDIIEPITDALSKVSTLSTVIYKFKDDETEQRRVGLIAQEVNEVLPEAVNSFKDEEKMWSVRYTEIIPLLTKAIQEQQTLITELQEKLERNNII